MKIINNNPKNLKIYYEVDGKKQYLHFRNGDLKIQITDSTYMVQTTKGKLLYNNQQWNGDKDELYIQKLTASQLIKAYDIDNGLTVEQVEAILNPPKKRQKNNSNED